MQVAKSSNSLAVRLPKKLVEELRLVADDELAIVDGSKDRVAVAKRDRRQAALDRMRGRHGALPADCRFDRDQAKAW